MSKILFTLAFYHDGGTLRPQLVVSCTPVTNLVVKAGDWKGARFSNANATDGARHRFEYSFTGGKSVTRCSLVMNTSAILPPLVWLSKHPTGAPTKYGPRGKIPKTAKEEAKLVALEELKKIEDKKRPIERRHTSPSSHRSSQRSSSRRDKSDDYGSEDEYERRRRRRIEARPSSDYYSRDDRSRSHHHSRSPESRRRDRHKRYDSASSTSSAEKVREDNRRRRAERRHDAMALDAGEYAVGGE